MKSSHAMADSGGGASLERGKQVREQETGIIKYRYRTHPAILANIPLSNIVVPTTQNCSRPTSSISPLLIEPAPVNGSGQLSWADQRLTAGENNNHNNNNLDDENEIEGGNKRCAALVLERKLRRVAVIEKGDEVGQLNYGADDDGTVSGLKLTNGPSGQVYVAQVAGQSLAERQGICAGDQLLAVNGELVEDAPQAERLIERHHQAGQLRLLYLSGAGKKRGAANEQLAPFNVQHNGLEAQKQTTRWSKQLADFGENTSGNDGFYRPVRVSDSNNFEANSLPGGSVSCFKQEVTGNFNENEITRNRRLNPHFAIENHQQQQQRERLMQKLDDFVEQYLTDESDKLNLSYYLNEFETNNCDLSDLLANLLQNLLIKLPNAFIKYKLLDYIKQLYVEPAMCSSSQSCIRQANANGYTGNLLYASGSSSGRIGTNFIKVGQQKQQQQQLAAQSAGSPHLNGLSAPSLEIDSDNGAHFDYLPETNKHLVDLRLFEAMQWRYLLASNALMRSSLASLSGCSSSSLASWTEMRKKRRRKRRAAQLHLPCNLRPIGEPTWLQGALQADYQRAPNSCRSTKSRAGARLINEEACQSLSYRSSSSDGEQLGADPSRRRRRQRQQHGVRNLGSLEPDPPEWPPATRSIAAPSLIHWGALGERCRSSSSISLIDYHSSESSNADNTNINDNNNNSKSNHLGQLGPNSQLEITGSTCNSYSNSNNNNNNNNNNKLNSQLDLGEAGQQLNLWPTGSADQGSIPAGQHCPDVPDTGATGRLFSRQIEAGKRHQERLRQAAMQRSQLQAGLQVAAVPAAIRSGQRQNHYPCISASLDSLPHLKQGMFPVPAWGRNNNRGQLAAECPPTCSPEFLCQQQRQQPPEVTFSDFAGPSYLAPPQESVPPPNNTYLGPAQMSSNHRPDLQASRRGLSQEQQAHYSGFRNNQNNAYHLLEDNFLRPHSCLAGARLDPSSVAVSGAGISGGLANMAARRASYGELASLVRPEQLAPTMFTADNEPFQAGWQTGPTSASNVHYNYGEQSRQFAQQANLGGLAGHNNVLEHQLVHPPADHQLGSAWALTCPGAGLLLAGSQQEPRCCSSARPEQVLCRRLDVPESSFQQAPGWRANSNSLVALASPASLKVGASNWPPAKPTRTEWVDVPPETRQQTAGGALHLEHSSYYKPPAPYASHLQLQQQAVYFEQPPPFGHIVNQQQQQLCSAETADFSPNAHDKLQLTFSEDVNATSSTAGGRMSRQLKQASRLPANVARGYVASRDRQPVGGSVSPPASRSRATRWDHHHRRRATSNQLKDGSLHSTLHSYDEPNERERDQVSCRRYRQERTETRAEIATANSQQASSQAHQVDYLYQYDSDQEQREEQELGLTAVPVQAKGRLSMSVAEQMKEQASAFVQHYNSSNSRHSSNSDGRRSNSRPKANLQVRRKLRVKIKKSKPILGIAIEGGFNVSGQLLPRIVCVHEDGAAYQCGKLRASDLILEVNGKSTVNMTHDEIAKTIATAYYQDPRSHIEFLIGESVQCFT